MATIKIKNLTGKHRQFRIDHQTVCVKVGKCLCRKGRRGPEALTIHVPGNGITGPLPPEVTKCPEIQQALRANELAVVGATVTETDHPTQEGKAQALDGSQRGTGRKGQKTTKGLSPN